MQFGIGGALALTPVFVPGQDPGLVGVLPGVALVAARLLVAIGRVGEIGGVVTHGLSDGRPSRHTPGHPRGGHP